MTARLALAGPLVVAALLAAGCGGGGGATAPAHSGSTADAGTGRLLARAGADDPRRLYVEAGCGDCHGLRAADTRGNGGPDFDTSERLGLAQIRASLTEGRNGMPSYAGRLDAAQLDALARWLYAVTH